MRITLKGKTEAENRSWDYDERMSLQEAMKLKDKLGLTVMGFTDGLAVMDPYALAGLVWLVRSRAGETLDPRLLDFDLGDLDIDDPEADTKAEAEVRPDEADPPVPAEGPAASSTTPTPELELEEVTGAAV